MKSSYELWGAFLHRNSELRVKEKERELENEANCC